MSKAPFQSIFEKIFKFQDWSRCFWTLKNFKMSWLATWFIFELLGWGWRGSKGTTSLQKCFAANDDRSNIHFLSQIFLKISPYSSFDVQNLWSNWKRKWYPFTASSFCFKENLPLLLTYPCFSSNTDKCWSSLTNYLLLYLLYSLKCRICIVVCKFNSGG